ncbi:hypothetical protein DPMN_060497 [Dreissena polymorpha]|uniref:Uncharacterized protein n=1 Tax=Dreissena polymorpha TaxID=45954 RepID=A0A9D4C5B8_DREPO|nr:hypothetical protein DPMN_060497 [Dreissena polymorpha]
MLESNSDVSRVMLKWVLCYMRPFKLQTSLRIHAVWSGAPMPAIKVRKVSLVDVEATDQTALLHRMVWSSAGCIWHKTHFCMTKLIYVGMDFYQRNNSAIVLNRHM